jgi:hypothetical protein
MCSEFPGMGAIFGAALGFYGFRADVLILLSLQHKTHQPHHTSAYDTHVLHKETRRYKVSENRCSRVSERWYSSPTSTELTRLGKSSLTVQLVDGHFVESYYPTIENTFRKTIKYRGHEYECEILDTAGQVRPPQRY